MCWCSAGSCPRSGAWLCCYSAPVISCLDDGKTHPFLYAQLHHLRFLEFSAPAGSEVILGSRRCGGVSQCAVSSLCSGIHLSPAQICCIYLVQEMLTWDLHCSLCFVSYWCQTRFGNLVILWYFNFLKSLKTKQKPSYPKSPSTPTLREYVLQRGSLGNPSVLQFIL